MTRFAHECHAELAPQDIRIIDLVAARDETTRSALLRAIINDATQHAALSLTDFRPIRRCRSAVLVHIRVSHRTFVALTDLASHLDTQVAPLVRSLVRKYVQAASGLVN